MATPDGSWLAGRRILVTGAAGFFGRRLVVRLAAAGARVSCLDSAPMPGPDLPAGCTARIGSLLDSAAVAEAVLGCDGVFHLAGVSRVATGREIPCACVAANIQGTANLLEAIRLSGDRPWLWWSSTRAALEDATAGSAALPSLYAVTKLAAGMIAERYARDYGLRVMTCYFPDLFGGSDDHADKVHMRFARQALAGLPLEVRDGAAVFDYVHWRDALEAVIAGAGAIASAPPGRHVRLRITGGSPVTLPQLAAAFIQASGRSSPLVMAGGTGPAGALPASDDGAIQVQVARTDLAASISELLDQCRRDAAGAAPATAAG